MLCMPIFFRNVLSLACSSEQWNWIKMSLNRIRLPLLLCKYSRTCFSSYLLRAATCVKQPLWIFPNKHFPIYFTWIKQPTAFHSHIFGFSCEDRFDYGQKSIKTSIAVIKCMKHFIKMLGIFILYQTRHDVLPNVLQDLNKLSLPVRRQGGLSFFYDVIKNPVTDGWQIDLICRVFYVP